LIKLILLASLNYNLCHDIYNKLSGKQPTEENLTVCSLLIEDSIKNDLDIEITLAVAWEESRFTEQSKPTKYKCIGPMQIKYEFWCPNNKNKVTATKRDGLISKCDVYYHGIKSLKYYINKFKPLNKAICYYNNSKKCSKNNNYKSDYVLNVNRFKSIITPIVKKKFN
tara:strand:- start:1106 stop:1609 length:504 start_codon:yes stop_codon:yes gene_type:complete